MKTSCLDELIYNLNSFKNTINAIENSKLSIPEAKGKPMEDTLKSAINGWNNDLKNIKQSLKQSLNDFSDEFDNNFLEGSLIELDKILQSAEKELDSNELKDLIIEHSSLNSIYSDKIVAVMLDRLREMVSIVEFDVFKKSL